MTAPAQTSEQRLAQFFRDMTLNNPKWISRAEALVNCGDKPMIRLLSGYLPVLPPSLRGAVLDARAGKSLLSDKPVETLKASSKDRAMVKP